MKVYFQASGLIAANDRIGAYRMANGIADEIEKRTGQKFRFHISDLEEDWKDEHRAAPGPRPEGRDEGARALREGPHPGDDFAEDGDEADAEHHARPVHGQAGRDGADGLQRPGDGDDAPKRGRGRPRKQRDGDDGEAGGEAPRKAAEGPERRAEGPGDAGRAAEGRGGDGPRGTAQGKGEGRGDRAEGAREPGERAPAAAGGRGGDQGQAGLTDDAGGMDFNDPEPDTALTMADVNRALTGLFVAMGKGATRKHIADALTDIAGVSQPKDIPEEGYAKVIREVEALAEVYKSGKRKI